MDGSENVPAKWLPAATRSQWQPALLLVGNRIRVERVRREWSSRELGRRTGLDVSVITRVESGVVDAKLSTLLLIAAALELEPSILIHDLPAG